MAINNGINRFSLPVHPFGYQPLPYSAINPLIYGRSGFPPPATPMHPYYPKLFPQMPDRPCIPPPAMPPSIFPSSAIRNSCSTEGSRSSSYDGNTPANVSSEETSAGRKKRR